jgi:hypothetical protein
MRTDIHCPSNIVPSDYQYVAVWTMNITGFGDSQFILREREIFKAHQERTAGVLVHRSAGACGICGNQQAIYLVAFYHAKSNEYIVAGVNCAQKLDLALDFEAIKLFKRRCADAREQQAGKRKAIALLGDAGLIDAWDIFNAEPYKHTAECATNNPGIEQYVRCTCGDTSNEFPERTITDIVSKLIRYGAVSDAQKSFVAKLLKQIQDRPIVEAQRQAERDAASPVEVGRHEVSGTVLSMKEVDVQSFSYHGATTAWKLLIRLDNGSKVWGSRFANLEKGDTIRFTATFEQSKDDPKFGFYKRPVAWKSPEETILDVFKYSWPKEVTNDTLATAVR